MKIQSNQERTTRRQGRRGWMPLAAAAAALLFLPLMSTAQNQRVSRVNTIDASARSRFTGSVAEIVKHSTDAGHLDGGTQITSMTLHFQLTAAQQADLTQLLTALHNPTSAEYHQWLTPAQFNERFGVSDADVQRTSAWLSAAGFTIVDATPMRIQFSGTAAQVEAAFSTEMHQYKTGEQQFYSNATELSVPSALNGVVSGITGVDSYRPHGNYQKFLKQAAINPAYTNSAGTHLVVPDDIRTIYDVNPLYTAGYTGAGKTLVVIGQSAIAASDISDFHTLFGGNTNLKQTLVPSTGTSTFRSGDEGESDLDVEYAGSIAKDATINLVYAGSSSNIFSAIQYAITQNLAPVITASYGECETAVSVTSAASYETLYAQGNAQGQTLIASTGDAGATECDSTSLETASSGLAIQFPSGSPYFTAVGGTEFNEGSGTYWNATNNAAYGSATSYIPEMVWDDTVENGSLAAGGGGVSKLFTKPSWQVATGVPADGMRDVPDVSLDASNDHDPYLYCTSDSGASPCSQGTAYGAGGTSFAAPVFAGMLTLFNEATASKGEGGFNAVLYPLFASKPKAFHDITVGNNDSPCVSGSTNCPAGTTAIGYNATTGYDLATGLGTVDAYVLASSLPGYGTGTQSTVSVTTLAFTPASPFPTQTIATVAKVTGTTGTPTGSVQLYLDGTAVGTALTLSSGTASYTLPAQAAGIHDVTAVYSGDSTFAASSGTAAVTVQAPLETSTVLTLSTPTPNTLSTLSVTAGVTSTTGVTSTAATGTMTFLVDGVTFGTAVTLTGGSATATIGQLTAGKHTVQANYSGSTSLASSIGYLGFIVTTGTASTVSVSLNPAAPTTAQAVSATAVVPPTATGTVQFAVDGTTLATGPVAGGQAYASLGTLTAGSHKLTATYSGDSNFGSSVATDTFSVTAGSTTGGTFTLSATNVTVPTNQSATSTITATSGSNYAGTVDLSVSGSVPFDVCYAVNGNPTVAAGTSKTTTVTILTGTSCHTFQSVHSIPKTMAATRGISGRDFTLAMLGGFGLLAGFLRKRRFAVALCGLLLTAAAVSMTGCSGGGSSSPDLAGTYTLTVTGTDSVNSGNIASTTLTLTIQ